MNSVPPSSPLEANKNPAVRLLGSSKGLITLIVIVACFAALFTHAATWDQISEFMKSTLIAFFGAHGVEEAARHIATGMSQRRADANVTVTTKKD